MTITPLIAAFIHFLLIVFVGAVPLTWSRQGKTFDVLLCFGAGVLLSAAFLHMLPEAITNLGPMTGVFVLVGYLIMTFLERFTMAHPCGEHACPNHRIGWVAFFGLSIHSIIAGIALGFGLMHAHDFSVAIALLAAILAHKIPETLALMGLFASSGWKKKQMGIVLTIFACMGPVGILVGSSFDPSSDRLLGTAMAISTGTFIYIASSDLLPHLHRKMKEEWVNFIAFLVGILALGFESWHHFFG